MVLPFAPMRFTPCGCAGGHYRHLPRKWWMRVFFGSRQRYRCSACKSTLLLSTRTAAPRRRVLLAAALAVILAGVWYMVGYFEEAREQNWRASIERE